MTTTRNGNGKRRLQRVGPRDEAGSPTDESENESTGEVVSQHKTSGPQNKTRSAQQSNKTTEQAARDEPENGDDDGSWTAACGERRTGGSDPSGRSSDNIDRSSAIDSDGGEKSSRTCSSTSGDTGSCTAHACQESTKWSWTT
ncbi:hypothetical protein GN958_ATG00404 [Phytophthora infestans]|uniref:Uncharacterized protein n=1 Tax=Phytophthora infestans TaxID=4787 RepID=A0A8S9VAI7_PHYIN|nr:hypothetical protein GN958_ATG00404 [Phytophthora infestans]